MEVGNWLLWDPPRELFIIPILQRPVAWYGVFFALGFILGYFFVAHIFQREFSLSRKEGTALADRLCWLVVFGTIIGARLGHVFFYDRSYFRAHPVDILKVWEGGLASHGATVGIIAALWIFRRGIRSQLPQCTLLSLLDVLVIPTALAGCCIRIGNFFNQEILGVPSAVPWAVIFGHPIDGSVPEPRHPVQLYEALAYLSAFLFLFILWKRGMKLGGGILTGLFFVMVYGSRFILEFFKAPQSEIIAQGSWLRMGQWLSIPFIVLGLVLLWRQQVKATGTVP